MCAPTSFDPPPAMPPPKFYWKPPAERSPSRARGPARTLPKRPYTTPAAHPHLNPARAPGAPRGRPAHRPPLSSTVSVHHFPGPSVPLAHVPSVSVHFPASTPASKPHIPSPVARRRPRMDVAQPPAPRAVLHEQLSSAGSHLSRMPSTLSHPLSVPPPVQPPRAPSARSASLKSHVSPPPESHVQLPREPLTPWPPAPPVNDEAGEREREPAFEERRRSVAGAGGRRVLKKRSKPAGTGERSGLARLVRRTFGGRRS
ncbi:hypothetical protein OF83DRAFT_1175748 [Amylostereum chailletii]|nr:hypothetical protein OF83DRAFT_1175748 [Amylostereum chailletii]